METIFMTTENSKTNEPHKSRLTLAVKLNFKDANKNIALANLSIYYTWKSITYNNNKFKISAPTWNGNNNYLVNNNYKKACKVLFTFVPNKQFDQLINISPH